MFFFLIIQGFTPTRSPRHCEKHPLYTGRVKVGLLHKRGSNKLFALKGGQTLGLILHETPESSDLPLRPTLGVESSLCYSYFGSVRLLLLINLSRNI
jgi:hypothetical protein